MQNCSLHHMDSQKLTAHNYFALQLEHIRHVHNIAGDVKMQIKPAHTSELRLPLLVNLIRHLIHQRFEKELGNVNGSVELDSMICLNSSRQRSPNTEELKNASTSVDTLTHLIPYMYAFYPSYFTFPTKSLEHLRIPSYTPVNSQKLIKFENKSNSTDCSDALLGPMYDSYYINKKLKELTTYFSREDDIRQSSSHLFSHSCFGFVSSQCTSPSDNFSVDYGNKLFSKCDFQTEHTKHDCDDIVKPELFHKMQTVSTFDEGDNIQELKYIRSTDSKHKCVSHLDIVKAKKKRPKRGQYRRYNSQLLVEAVRAVQRGEMSVHRAGSYFGVPHSTLEYKVKERHLLRQKKNNSSVNFPSTPSTNTSVSVTTLCEDEPCSIIGTSVNTEPSWFMSPTMMETDFSQCSMVSSTTQTTKSFNMSMACADNVPEPHNFNSVNVCSGHNKTVSSTQNCLAKSFENDVSQHVEDSHFGGKIADSQPANHYFTSNNYCGYSGSVNVGVSTSGLSLNITASELLRRLQSNVEILSVPSFIHEELL